MKLNELIENPDNPSKCTESQLDRLAGKLKRVPLGLTAMRIAYVTDAVDGKKMVISGNKRLRVLKRAYGEDAELPDEWFQDVTKMSESERHEFIVTANVSDGEWDKTKLLEQYESSELRELMDDADVDQLLHGFELLEKAREAKRTEDEIPDVDVATVSELGKMYKLGRHTLMCGDSTKTETVDSLFSDGKQADLVVTDPPYNISYEGVTTKRTRIQNDSMSDEKFMSFMESVYGNMNKNLKNGGAFYIWCCNLGPLVEFEYALRKFQELQLKNKLIWVKDRPIFSQLGSIFSHQYETCLFGWKSGAPNYHNSAVKKMSDVIDDSPDLDKMTKTEAIELLKDIYDSTDIIRTKRPSSSRLHPTMKPVEMIENQIRLSSREKEIVLDLFLGSGTTLIACEKSDRECRGVEYDPHYCDVIRKRWAEYVYGEGCDWKTLTPEVS